MKIEVLRAVAVYRPYPQKLESLTFEDVISTKTRKSNIWSCHYKDSTFSSVIARPWVLIRPKSWSHVLLHSIPTLNQLSQPIGGINKRDVRFSSFGALPISWINVLPPSGTAVRDSHAIQNGFIMGFNANKVYVLQWQCTNSWPSIPKWSRKLYTVRQLAHENVFKMAVFSSVSWANFVLDWKRKQRARKRANAVRYEFHSGTKFISKGNTHTQMLWNNFTHVNSSHIGLLNQRQGLFIVSDLVWTMLIYSCKMTSRYF